MSKRCQRCDRSATTGHRVSHSNIKTKRRFGINLQWKRVALRAGGALARTRICTRCIKTLAKQAAA